MNKVLTIIFVVLVAVVGFIAIYSNCFRKSIPEGTSTEKTVAILQQNDCFVCHSASAKAPAYANFPVIGKMISQHIDHAKKFVDLETPFFNPDGVSEVTVAMIEHSLIYNTMPISEYKMIHWGTTFNKKEKAVLADWIVEMRNGNAGITPIPDSIPVNPLKVILGEKMYNDGRISLDGTISCASCHILKDGGADEESERTSEGIDGQHGGVNAPTVFNSYFNVQQFWNGRAADLQEQAAGPPVNPVEMGDQTWEQIVERLRCDKALVKEFNALYPGEGLTQTTVTDAIAEFEKTLLTPDSRFDLYLKGDESAITEEEKAGFEAFKKNSCATCHTGVILGGKSFEHISVYGNYFADRDSSIQYNSDDDGLKGFTGNDADFQKFKVPGLRNVEMTPPYFHDGTMTTLEDAVRAMAKYELGKQLDESDVKVIVAFMKTLTGKSPYFE